MRSRTRPLLLAGACASLVGLAACDDAVPLPVIGSAPLSELTAPSQVAEVALRSAALVALAPVAAVAPVPVLPAQDPPPAPAQEAPTAPAAPAAPPADLPVDTARLAERMISLVPAVRTRPDTRVAADSPDLVAARAEVDRKRRAWESDVEDLAAAAVRYLGAVGPDGGEPRALWAAGLGLATKADLESADKAVHSRIEAARTFERALAGSSKDADFRGDIEAALGRVLVTLLSRGQSTPEQIVEHLTAAVKILRTEQRVEEVGSTLVLAIQTLLKSKRAEAAEGLIAATGADTGEFGPSTQALRVQVAAARTGVGAKLPALADAKDEDGKPVTWAAFKGKVLLLHFFMAGQPTGYPTEQRDAETAVRPAYDELHPRGLEVVGIAMDWEMPPEKVAQTKANWDEWGVKKSLHTGSAASVRGYAEAQGIVWPYVRAGLWTNDPISRALGGPGVSRAHAILVDAEGVIRWRGDAPFVGLVEEARKLLPGK